MVAQIASKTPTEAVPVEWDFTDVVSGSVTLISITKETITGTDPNAGTLNIGTPLVASGFVSAVVGGGTNNCSYQLICTITDSANRIHQLALNHTTTTDAA